MEWLTEATATSALAVVAVQQILKLNIVPATFANRWPVATNIILSIMATIFVQYQNFVNLVTWQDWILSVAFTSVVAAITYNNILKNSDAIKRLESN